MTGGAGSLLNTLPVAVLGGLFGLDVVSFPQVMMSRPIVSATVAGAFVGRPAAGLLIGVILELIALETLPFGASRYAEWGSAGVVGGAIFGAQSPSASGGLPISILAALAAAMFGSWSMVVLRKANARCARAVRPAIDGGSSNAVTALQLRGLLNDLVRGTVVTWVSVLVFLPLSHAVTVAWKTDAIHSRAFVIALAAMVAAGAVWKLFHSSARGGWFFLIGLGVGAGLLVMA